MNNIFEIFISIIKAMLGPYNILYPGYVRCYPGVYPGLAYIPASSTEGGNSYNCVHTIDLFMFQLERTAAVTLEIKKKSYLIWVYLFEA